MGFLILLFGIYAATMSKRPTTPSTVDSNFHDYPYRMEGILKENKAVMMRFRNLFAVNPTLIIRTIHTNGINKTPSPET
jgi:hypothetical protein